MSVNEYHVSSDKLRPFRCEDDECEIIQLEYLMEEDE